MYFLRFSARIAIANHPIDEFQCNNAIAINSNQKCNGIRDCADGSDEEPALCRSYICSLNEFKCDYGACVKDLAVCDTNTARHRPIPSRLDIVQHSIGGSATCQILRIPLNGNAQNAARPGILLNKGDRVAHENVIVYQCVNGLKLIGEMKNRCVNGHWMNNVPQCTKSGIIRFWNWSI